MMRGALVFVESNTTGTGRLFLKAAAAEGCIPVLLTRDATRYAFAADEARIVAVDTGDETALRAACATLAASDAIAGITSTSDYFLEAAARLAAWAGLPGPGASAIADCRDKQRQYAILLAAGVPLPRTLAAETVEAACAVVDALGLPLVLKPVGGSGSVGVRLCRTVAEVRAHATALLAVATNERGLPMRRAILLQRWIEGPEYSVETLAGQVIGITAKHVSEPPTFVELGHDFPATLPADEASTIAAVAQRAVTALKLDWGAAHTEIRFGREGPVVIEVNPRLAGGMIPELIRQATGIDVIRQTIRRILGKPVVLEPSKSGHASIRFAMPPRDGVLAAPIDLDAARRADHVCEAASYRTPGTRLMLSGDFHDRIGHVMTAHPDPATTRAAADRALALLSIDLE